MTYKNLTDINVTKNFGIEVLEYANEVSLGALGWMTMLGIFVLITFIYLAVKRDIIEGILISSFITTIIGITFWAAGFIDQQTFIITLAVFVLGNILIWFVGKSSN